MPNYSTIDYIYAGLEDLINDLLRKELEAQGHRLTGRLADSLDGSIIANESVASLVVVAAEYARWIDEGIKSEDISWRMLPGLTQYFIRRGFGLATAQRYAEQTIGAWQRQGMPTEDSARYSSTGKRTGFIEAALNKPEVDQYMSDNLDLAIELMYRLTKSEII